MLLAIDQGTTGSRAFVFSPDGTVAASAYSEFGQHFPQPGWVEHDAGDLVGAGPYVQRLGVAPKDQVHSVPPGRSEGTERPLGGQRTK